MLLLVDANVLIDFVLADRRVLALVAAQLGAVHVPRDVLDEVDQLDEAACAELGLVVVDATVAQLLEAGASRGRLSFADRVCLVLARDHGWTCVTNDGRLRRTCEAGGVSVMWGLQLLLALLETGVMDPASAIAVATAIGRTNPRMSPAVVQAFVRKVRDP
ncbi:MAG: PIN domain-containing protein [Thermoanaerobaculia bacterium]